MPEDSASPSPSPLIYIIAGEASGDFLGARLMAAIKRKTGGAINFSGVGGTNMQAEGLSSLFPYDELSIVGFVEVIPHLPKLLQRLRQVCRDIIKQKPDMVITIDSPGFNFPLAARIRKAMGDKVKLVHYVAPTVWAYKPERAQKIARIYDHLLLLLPFEKPYFDDVNLPCSFIGHQVVWEESVIKAKVGESATGGDRENFRKRHAIEADAPLLCVLPGSRKVELMRHLPIFKQTAELLAKWREESVMVVVVGENLLPYARSMLGDWALRVIAVASENEKQAVFTAADAALAKSGTVTLEVARAALPMVVTYRVNPLSAWKLRRMIRVPYVSLINLILDKMVVPELLQEDCTAANITASIIPLLEDKSIAQSQLESVKSALERLGMGSATSPSERAASEILRLINP